MTFFAINLFGQSPQANHAKDSNFILNALNVGSFSEIKTPSYEVLETNFIESSWVDQKTKKSQTIHYMKKHILFRNALGLRVTGILLEPWGYPVGKVGAVIYEHEELSSWELGAEELFRLQSAGTKNCHWAEHLMNQGYVVLALDAPGYGQRIPRTVNNTKDNDKYILELDVSYGKRWDLNTGQIHALEKAHAFQILSGHHKVDPEKISSLKIGAKDTGFDGLLDDMGLYLKTKISNHDKHWTPVSVYTALKQLNVFLQGSKVRPRMNTEFFWQMVKYANAEKKLSCEKALTADGTQGELF